MSSDSLISRGLSEYRSNGLRKLIISSSIYTNLNCQGYFYYLKFMTRRFDHRNYQRPPDPFQTIIVNPNNIIYKPTKRFDKWSNMGEIKPGDWDEPDSRFVDNRGYQRLHRRFVDGDDWEEIPYIQYALETVANGETVWNGCRTEDDVWERCQSLDELYNDIKKNGFRSQAEIHEKSIRSILLSRHFDRSKTDVAVHIGRDGKLLYVDGGHRLSIAKILDIDEIPVRVVVRHNQWQCVREAFGSPDTQLPKEYEKYESHPDICQTGNQ